MVKYAMNCSTTAKLRNISNSLTVTTMMTSKVTSSTSCSIATWPSTPQLLQKQQHFFFFFAPWAYYYIAHHSSTCRCTLAIHTSGCSSTYTTPLVAALWLATQLLVAASWPTARALPAAIYSPLQQRFQKHYIANQMTACSSTSTVYSPPPQRFQEQYIAHQMTDCSSTATRRTTDKRTRKGSITNDGVVQLFVIQNITTVGQSTENICQISILYSVQCTMKTQETTPSSACSVHNQQLSKYYQAVRLKSLAFSLQSKVFQRKHKTVFGSFYIKLYYFYNNQFNSDF